MESELLLEEEYINKVLTVFESSEAQELLGFWESEYPDAEALVGDLRNILSIYN